jgi:hypothetical protein
VLQPIQQTAAKLACPTGPILNKLACLFPTLKIPLYQHSRTTLKINIPFTIGHTCSHPIPILTNQSLAGIHPTKAHELILKSCLFKLHKIFA